MALRDLIIDVWAPLAYKGPFSRGDAQSRQAGGALAHSWLPEEDRRRITGYTVLAAYDLNSARSMLSQDVDGSPDHREYGDPSVVVDSTLSHLLGVEQRITVEGADGEEPDPAAVAREDFLRLWARDENLEIKLQDCERRSVLLGDGVYLLAWNAAKQRPTLSVVDPGFYFPVLPEGMQADEYPETVHFAWETETSEGRKALHRVTYELGPIGPSTQTQIDPKTSRLSTVYATNADGSPVLSEGDTLAPDGSIARRYPWSQPGEASNRTCYLTEATWDMADPLSAATDVWELDPSRAMFAVNRDGQVLDRMDLHIDFIPVIHVPNTVAGSDHYGQSSLAKVLQLLDDLAAADTDAQAASSTTGSPIIGIGGNRLPAGAADGTLKIAPGTVWGLGEGGSMETLDTSNQLAELRAFVKDLRDRLSVNSHLPSSVLGTVTAADAVGGFALLLSFAPLQAMIRSMRLTRAAKYPLLLKMVQRLYQAGGVLDPGDTLRADLTFGSYLPADRSAVIDEAARAYTAKLISLSTAVKMLADAGVPIEDFTQEVARIQAGDFTGANLLADATGDNAEVRKYLGLPEAPSRGAVAPTPVAAPGASSAPPAAPPTEQAPATTFFPPPSGA